MSEAVKCPLGMATCTPTDGPCSYFCTVVARRADALRELLARADAVEAEQAEARRLNGRAWGHTVLNGTKKP
jgi:hypothetical protein